MITWQSGKKRMDPNAGIAIGPILFIIAILAILAAAIAAGSGSFTSGTTTESNRTKSSALVQIGENLKVGMDRITLEGGLTMAGVDTNVSNTAATNALFSPVGGGIAPPSVGMANAPTQDVWYFPQGPVKGVGTGANNLLAVIPVAAGVCSEINNRTMGNATTPSTAALGNFVAGVVTGASAWPFPGVGEGCVQDSSVTAGTSGASTQYFFYQILAIQ